MPIFFDEKANSFKLDTPNSSYIIKIMPLGYVSHLYYGGRISDSDVDYLYQCIERPYSTNPDGIKTRDFSLEHLPQEYPCNGTGDFRTSAITIRTEKGNTSTDLRYKSYKIYAGKPKLEGLPAVYTEDEGQADTLELILEDKVSGAEVTLIYTAFRSLDVMTRSVKVTNRSSAPIAIERIMSTSVDFNESEYDFIHLYGTWANERMVSRTKLHHGKQGFESKRGTSSHQHNPFFALAMPNTDENMGEVYGFNMVYSGNHFSEVEVDGFKTTRAIMGINPTDFEWFLERGETFTAPEVVMVYSNKGLGEMSRTYHKLYQNHLCRGEWRYKRRPILINNWEATYFDFDDDKLIHIAKGAAELGIEMLVMDDGWFGRRNDDYTSLGDWFVNEEKLKGGLSSLVERVNAVGIKFGIWVEPEMISPDSDLYRAHPEWCLQVEGRAFTTGRSQLVLDMTRKDVRDYLFKVLSDIFSCTNIEYVKWDMNRHLTEVGSLLIPANRQKEIFHRYVLGVYDILERITLAFPHILFEGCSGGGGRFDPGMLYYSPQIWTSDDTDAMERVKIQWGTSMCYPVSSMGAHVSACPNHQTMRDTSFETRGAIAMSGTFGYELDVNKLSEKEKEMVKKQVHKFKEYYDVITYGDHYRLLDPFKNSLRAAWGFISQDKNEILITFVQIKGEASGPLYKIRFAGADPNKKYQDTATGRIYRGDTLINAGIMIPYILGDGVTYMCHLKTV
ncbi:MAG: Alpha-galactosidase [Clostridia bacterium]|jgi:alpha-galactosidase|nr:Alpha-galactosidase [Clostridia bacterium]